MAFGHNINIFDGIDGFMNNNDVFKFVISFNMYRYIYIYYRDAVTNRILEIRRKYKCQFRKLLFILMPPIKSWK